MVFIRIANAFRNIELTVWVILDQHDNFLSWFGQLVCSLLGGGLSQINVVVLENLVRAA